MNLEAKKYKSIFIKMKFVKMKIKNHILGLYQTGITSMLNLKIQFENPIWRSNLKIHFENLIWKSNLKIKFDNAMIKFETSIMKNQWFRKSNFENSILKSNYSHSIKTLMLNIQLNKSNFEKSNYYYFRVSTSTWRFIMSLFNCQFVN